ncbi:hypothetical protein FB451DRAFT_1187905 [Mycena latifolia]|nr:hypothetical protein FB451DRAFT_1187905 [Mycena latifolia]
MSRRALRGVMRSSERHADHERPQRPVRAQQKLIARVASGDRSRRDRRERRPKLQTARQCDVVPKRANQARPLGGDVVPKGYRAGDTAKPSQCVTSAHARGLASCTTIGTCARAGRAVTSAAVRTAATTAAIACIGRGRRSAEWDADERTKKFEAVNPGWRSRAHENEARHIARRRSALHSTKGIIVRPRCPSTRGIEIEALRWGKKQSRVSASDAEDDLIRNIDLFSRTTRQPPLASALLLRGLVQYALFAQPPTLVDSSARMHGSIARDSLLCFYLSQICFLQSAYRSIIVSATEPWSHRISIYWDSSFVMYYSVQQITLNLTAVPFSQDASQAFPMVTTLDSSPLVVSQKAPSNLQKRVAIRPSEFSLFIPQGFAPLNTASI